jgi:hypothetical protein
MKLDLTVVLRDEPELVAVNDRQIQWIVHLAGHLKKLLLAEVQHHRSLGSGRPVPNWLGQDDDVNFLYFRSNGHCSPV